MITGMLLCLYTYIFQYEAIYHTFNSKYGWNYDVTSIFSVKTEYGFMLYICSIFSIIYVLNTKKYWFYFFPIIFEVNMFISRSKTSILTSSIILITLIVVHIIKSWNEYKNRWLVSFAVMGSIFLSILILTILKVGWFEKFNYYITQVIINDGRVVLEDRFHKWSLLLQAIDNPFNIMFGYGERITPLVLSKCGCATIGDNIYISTYGVGGLVKLSLYISVIIYILRFTTKRRGPLFNKIIILSMQISFIVGGLFEDDSIMGVTMSGLFSSIIFYSCNRMIGSDILND